MNFIDIPRNEGGNEFSLVYSLMEEEDLLGQSLSLENPEENLL